VIGAVTARFLVRERDGDHRDVAIPVNCLWLLRDFPTVHARAGLGTISALSPWYRQVDYRGLRMFNSLMMLAFEANGVVALRMMKLMRGGRSARAKLNEWSAKRWMRLSRLPHV
jgi:hypothetical protein